MFLPKLAGSRRIDTMHNDDILDVSTDRFAVLSDASLEELCIKMIHQREETPYLTQALSNSRPSSPEFNNLRETEVNRNHGDVLLADSNPDVGKKISNIFAVDKFKRKSNFTSEMNCIETSRVAPVAKESECRGKLTTGLLESNSGFSSSPESQITESNAPNR
jgi:hypothetical protein